GASDRKASVWRQPQFAHRCSHECTCRSPRSKKLKRHTPASPPHFGQIPALCVLALIAEILDASGEILEASGDLHVIEVAQVIADSDVIEYAAPRAEWSA